MEPGSAEGAGAEPRLPQGRRPGPRTPGPGLSASLYCRGRAGGLAEAGPPAVPKLLPEVRRWQRGEGAAWLGGFQ